MFANVINAGQTHTSARPVLMGSYRNCAAAHCRSRTRLSLNDNLWIINGIRRCPKMLIITASRRAERLGTVRWQRRPKRFARTDIPAAAALPKDVAAHCRAYSTAACNPKQPNHSHRPNPVPVPAGESNRALP